MHRGGIRAAPAAGAVGHPGVQERPGSRGAGLGPHRRAFTCRSAETTQWSGWSSCRGHSRVDSGTSRAAAAASSTMWSMNSSNLGSHWVSRSAVRQIKRRRFRRQLSPGPVVADGEAAVEVAKDAEGGPLVLSAAGPGSDFVNLISQRRAGQHARLVRVLFGRPASGLQVQRQDSQLAVSEGEGDVRTPAIGSRVAEGLQVFVALVRDLLADGETGRLMVEVVSRYPPALARRRCFGTSGHFHVPVGCGEHSERRGRVFHLLEGHDVRVDLADTVRNGIVIRLLTWARSLRRRCRSDAPDSRSRCAGAEGRAIPEPLSRCPAAGEQQRHPEQRAQRGNGEFPVRAAVRVRDVTHGYLQACRCSGLTGRRQG